MAELERLDIDQLAELERLLVNQEAPVVQRFQPPASGEALAAVEAYLGAPLPDELREWWGWHNGIDESSGERPIQSSIGPIFFALSTVGAVETSRELRIGAEEDAPEDPDSLWASSWIAIRSQGRVACECNIPTDAPVPVLHVDYHKAAYPGAVICHSLGRMVQWWIEALESGAWRYDREDGRWERVFELVPPERDEVGLV
ncbi:MAG: SMI1/KNR4 family protein [Actinomycetota bacterium]|nr:SMI1/KNR4 family protein [Actinomycetota bacterium]